MNDIYLLFLYCSQFPVFLLRIYERFASSSCKITVLAEKCCLSNMIEKCHSVKIFLSGLLFFISDQGGAALGLHDITCRASAQRWEGDGCNVLPKPRHG